MNRRPELTDRDRWAGIAWGLLAIIPALAWVVITTTTQHGAITRIQAAPPPTPETAPNTAHNEPQTPISQPQPQPATATEHAERLNPPTTPPTTTIELDPCTEMAGYRALVGLPPELDRIGYRESRCLNRDDVRTSCCHGWWQLYIELHLKDHRLAPLYAACGITSPDDVNSDTPTDKLRQACAAKALYDVQGLNAWALTR